MSIERKCENCANTYCEYCVGKNLYRDFIPKEELVRQDERDKFITLLKSDLETLDKESKHYNNFKEYIESTIELLEKEQ